MPRMPMFSAEERVANGATRSEGTEPSARLASEIAWRSASASAPTTDTEIGVSCRLVSRFCALTTTESRVVAAIASRPAAGASSGRSSANAGSAAEATANSTAARVCSTPATARERGWVMVWVLVVGRRRDGFWWPEMTGE